MGLELWHIRGDGHCLIHAFVKSLECEQLDKVTFATACQNMFEEVKAHAEYYSGFLPEGIDS